MSPRSWLGQRTGDHGGRHRARSSRRQTVLALVGLLLAVAVIAAMVLLVVIR
jgi:hypothetical protein